MRDPRLAGIEWRDLVALRPREVAAELALPLVGLAGVWLAGRAGGGVALALATAAMFTAGLRVAHAGFHRALGLGARATDVVLFALSLLLGGAAHAIEVTHLRHHRDCLAADDVEGRLAAHGFGRALLASARYPIEIHASALVHGSRRQRRWIGAELAGIALVQAWIWTQGGATVRAMALWLLVANAMAPMPGIWLVHRGCHHGDARIARSARAAWLVRLTLSMFHHAEHHAFPAVPTRRLRELARRFDARGATPPPLAEFSTARVDGPVDKLWIEVRKRRPGAGVKRGWVKVDQVGRHAEMLRAEG